MHILLNHIKQYRVGHIPFQLTDHLLFTDVPVITANVRSVDEGVFSAGQGCPHFRYRNHATAMPAQVHATGRFWQQRLRQQRWPTSISARPAHTTAPNCGHPAATPASAPGDNAHPVIADTGVHPAAPSESANARCRHWAAHDGDVGTTSARRLAMPPRGYSYSRLKVATALNGPRSMVLCFSASGSPCT